MLFNSIEFVLFLPIVIILYYLVPKKYRWILLLGASYIFYMYWKVEYIFLIAISTLIDYYAGLKLDTETDAKKRKRYLVISLISNLGFLFAFKYFNFFTDTLNWGLSQAHIEHQLPMLKVLLPVGISFYTFQTMSYTIDVYKGRQKAERHLGYFALYVTFFPQLVAGPIERFSNLNPQLKQHHPFTYTNLANGLRLILYGLFVKMVIADNISGYVDTIYNQYAQYNSWSIIKGLVFYSFQIYSDFYGYSLIAIGSARIMGINLMDNFKTPYLAKNIQDFWQRWHISLSTWFRDYVFIPLGGSRVSWFKWVFNIMVVFTVSGLWHGANFTFIVWGALFGIIYLIESNFNKQFGTDIHAKPYSITHILLASKTFILVTLIWVFFRSQNLGQVMAIFNSIANNWAITQHLAIEPPVLILFSLFVLSDILLYNKRFDTWLDPKPMAVRWGIYALLIFGIIVFSGVDNFPFIYFQF
jgi:alginate O-acetyltransferase complex protein AlgI